MAQAAKFIAKVYDRTGATYKTTIDADTIISLPRISREVSKAASEVTLALAKPWNDFGFPLLLSEGFLVKLYAVNSAHPTGILVYQGFITQIKTKLSGSPEITLYPLESILGNAFWKSGGGETIGDYTVVYAAADVDTMFSNAITNANSVHGSYFTADLDNPAASLTVNFVENTHAQAMQTAIGFLDDTWYWRTRPDGTIQLKQFNEVTPTHTFVLGRDVAELEATRTIVNVKKRYSRSIYRPRLFVLQRCYVTNELRETTNEAIE